MDAKLVNLHEMSKLLSVKNRLGADLMSYFGLFGLGNMLRRLSLEKQSGVSAVQLILSLCIFRINQQSVHSVYRHGFYNLLETGKNCYYRMLAREVMDWRRLLLGMACRFNAVIRKHGAQEGNSPSCFIVDDTTLEKTGVSMEAVSRVYDHVKGCSVLGYKLLLLAFFDGRSTLPVDFTLHREKGRNKDFGLTDKQRKGQFSKRRDKSSAGYARLKECDKEKPAMAMDMIRRAWTFGIRASYVLADSWFTSEDFIASVRKIGKGALHFVGLAKMGGTKYLVRGHLHNAIELATMYERDGDSCHECRKYRLKYISLKGMMGNQPVRIFLVKYRHNNRWNILLTTDLGISFIKTFETYQIRWNIEVMNKECKGYLGLGKYQGRDFDGQIADCTLCFITYTVMVLEKRFSDYETIGGMFAQEREDIMALTLWHRILACIERLLQTLARVLGYDPEELIGRILEDEKSMGEYKVMADALEKYREKQCTA